MPTDSLFNSVEIKDKKSAKKFIKALKKASKKKFKRYKIPEDIKIIWKG